MPEHQLFNSGRQHAFILLIIGGLLIVHPFVISVDELADRDPVYERTNISVYASGVDWERGTAAVPWKGIDCVEEDPEQHRRCALEQALVKEPITVPGETPLERRGSNPDPYVLLPSGFYERTYKEMNVSGGDSVQYDLTRVSGQTVLREVAVSPTQAPAPITPAAKGQAAVTESQIDETYLIRDNDRFFLITRTDMRSPPLSDFYTPLSAVGFILGAFILVWSGRTFVLSR